MSKLSIRFVLAAVVAAVFVSGQATAGSRRTAPATAPSSGVIVGIDRTERVIVVAERVGGPTVRIRVPKNTKVATTWSQTRGSSISFELLHIGLQYRGIVPE